MKLILQFIKPHWKMCLATILLLIVDVTGALYISTLAAEMLNLGTSGASFDMLLNTGLQMAVASIVSSACAILGGYACAADNVYDSILAAKTAISRDGTFYIPFMNRESSEPGSDPLLFIVCDHARRMEHCQVLSFLP